MGKFFKTIGLLVLIHLQACLGSLTAAYFRPSDELDFASLSSSGNAIFVVGGWFKWSSCDHQHVASDSTAEKGDMNGSEDWIIWHSVTLLSLPGTRQRQHQCGKWVAAAWVFSISGGVLAANPTNAYMMPHVDPASPPSATSKEIIYTVGYCHSRGQVPSSAFQ